MRRLNGRKMIMAFLGRSPRSKDGWRIVRERFGEVIYCDPPHRPPLGNGRRLIAADKARHLTMTEFLKSRGPKGDGVGKHVGGFPGEFARIVKRITGM